MAMIRLQVSSIDNLGLWDKVCEYKGWNPWIRNEGMIPDDEWVEFDDEFNKGEEEFKNDIVIEGVVRLDQYESVIEFQKQFYELMGRMNWTFIGNITKRQ